MQNAERAQQHSSTSRSRGAPEGIQRPPARARRRPPHRRQGRTVNLKRRQAARHIDIQLTDAAKDFLAKEGYDPTYGARPLKRAIQREIQDKLAMKLLEGEFKEGDKITVDATSDGQIVFEKAGAAEPAVV